MEKDIAYFFPKKIMKKKIVVIKVINMCVYKMCSPFVVFISIRRINCYMICLFNYTCHFIWEETYISNIASFPDLSVIMFTNV